MESNNSNGTCRTVLINSQLGSDETVDNHNRGGTTLIATGGEIYDPTLALVQGRGNGTVLIASGMQMTSDPIITANNYFIYLNNCTIFFIQSAKALEYVVSKPEIYHDGIWKDFGFLA